MNGFKQRLSGVAAALALAGCLAAQAAEPEGLYQPPTIDDGLTYRDEVTFVSDVTPTAYMDCCDPSCAADCGCGDECGCGDACGCGKKKAAKPNPCMTSHKGVYYANDFSYLKDPCYRGDCLGDCMKLMDVCYGTLDIGGQLRLRYHHEEGMARQAGASGFQDTTNDFMLTRLRLYTNWKMNDWCRIYAEGITADVTSNSAYLPRPIDRNSGDFLNLFVDLGLTDSTTVRVGRQELLLGNQRHISPLDWANTRRTFEGIRMLYSGDDWAVDGFYTNLVPVDPDNFDEADYDTSFYGLYATYTGAASASYDIYYLGLDNQTPYTGAAPAINAAAAGTADYSIHTFGGRMFGGAGDWLYEMEAAYQTGRQSGLGLDHRAGMCTCGVGRKLPGSWTPALWFYYDYASGNDEDDGVFNRYNQLFPLAHKYLGFIDAVARANVSAPNCLLTMQPTSKWSLLCWYYYLGAATEFDVIPGVAVPSMQNTTSDNFGNELDLLAKYQINARSNIFFAYSHLWRGSKIVGTDDASFFYSQWELNF